MCRALNFVHQISKTNPCLEDISILFSVGRIWYPWQLLSDCSESGAAQESCISQDENTEMGACGHWSWYWCFLPGLFMHFEADKLGQKSIEVFGVASRTRILLLPHPKADFTTKVWPDPSAIVNFALLASWLHMNFSRRPENLLSSLELRHPLEKMALN